MDGAAQRDLTVQVTNDGKAPPRPRIARIEFEGDRGPRPRDGPSRSAHRLDTLSRPKTIDMEVPQLVSSIGAAFRMEGDLKILASTWAASDRGLDAPSVDWAAVLKRSKP